MFNYTKMLNKHVVHDIFHSKIEKLNEDIEIETENSIESESQSSVEIEPSDLVKSQDEEVCFAF